MGLKLERFEMVGSSFSAKVSIRNNGQIGISQGALKKMGISNDGHRVVLFFDAEARVMGIRPTTNEKDTGAIAVHLRPAGNDGSLTAHISGKSFLECYGIPYAGKSRSFEPVWSDEHKMFLVDLNKEKGIRRKPQKSEPAGEQEGGQDETEALF